MTVTTPYDERLELAKAALPTVIDKAGKNDTAQDIAVQLVAIVDAVVAELDNVN